MSDTDLMRRALAAYVRSGGDPSEITPVVEELDGRQYVVLRDPGGVAAVYRVRAYDGILRRMKRWPQAIT